VRVDGRPVAARDRPGELEAVLDRPPHQRVERRGRRARSLEQGARGASERDEVVRGDRGARVVGGALVVGEREGLEAERPGEPEPDGEPVVAVGRDGRARA
jgi:hypothetical protein